MIKALTGYNPSFGAARLNILATSDNHGNFLSWPMLAQTVQYNQKDIFAKAEDESTLNIFAVVGDWFINPFKKGFLTNPNIDNGTIQYEFLEEFINFVKNQAGKNAKFDTVFAIGNHDLDAGDMFMDKIMEIPNMKTIITNVDFKNSPEIIQMMKKNKNIVKSYIYKIPDDNKPDLSHNVLVMGVTIPSMQFYNPGLVKKMKFYDDCNKKDTNLTETDLQNTFKIIKEEVDNFKAENPKGAVILLSHTGLPIAKMIVKHVPDINVVLNGHDHKNLTTMINQTNIDSLGKDNEIIKGISIKFDDNGNIEKNISTYYPEITPKTDLDKNPLQILLNRLLKEDIKPLVSLTDITGKETELVYTKDDIRCKNSYLANWLTGAIKGVMSNIYKENDIIVGIQSSSIRGGLKNGSNNLDVMKVFDGLSESLSDVKIGTIYGSELVGLIVENVQENLKNPKRNTLIQWSDIQVNKTLIAEILAGKSNKPLESAIKIKDNTINEFCPINLNKCYRIALGGKFLIKDDIIWPSKIRKNFSSLNITYDKLLRNYIKSDNINYQLKVTEATKEDHIL